MSRPALVGMCWPSITHPVGEDTNILSWLSSVLVSFSSATTSLCDIEEPLVWMSPPTTQSPTTFTSFPSPACSTRFLSLSDWMIGACCATVGWAVKARSQTTTTREDKKGNNNIFEKGDLLEGSMHIIIGGRDWWGWWGLYLVQCVGEAEHSLALCCCCGKGQKKKKVVGSWFWHQIPPNQNSLGGGGVAPPLAHKQERQNTPHQPKPL